MMILTCWTVVPGVIPGTPIEIKAYAVQNNRRSVPDVTYHSTSKILSLGIVKMAIVTYSSLI